MKNIKFNLSGIDYRIQVTKKETGSNYNLFASIFKGEDKKSPLAGTSFNDNTTKEQFLEWGKVVMVRQHLKTLKERNLNYCTKNGIEYHIGYNLDKAVIFAFIHDESIYFIDKNELREMALTAKVKGINHVTLYTNYGLELHSKYETPFTVGMNVIEKIALN